MSPVKIDMLSKENQKKVTKAIHKRIMANEQPKKRAATHIVADKKKKKKGTYIGRALKDAVMKVKAKVARSNAGKKDITVSGVASTARARNKRLEEISI